MEVVASLSQGRTAAAQCGLFTHKSVPVIFEPPCIYFAGCFLGLCLLVLGKKREPIPGTERSKTWVFVLSLVGVAGSNPAGGMAACFL